MYCSFILCALHCAHAVRSLVLAHGIVIRVRKGSGTILGTNLLLFPKDWSIQAKAHLVSLRKRMKIQMRKMARELVHSLLRIFYSVGPVEELS